MYYLYEDHCGGYFYTKTQLAADECYCELCNDNDVLVRTSKTLAKLKSSVNVEVKKKLVNTH